MGPANPVSVLEECGARFRRQALNNNGTNKCNSYCAKCCEEKAQDAAGIPHGDLVQTAEGQKCPCVRNMYVRPGKKGIQKSHRTGLISA